MEEQKAENIFNNLVEMIQKNIYKELEKDKEFCKYSIIVKLQKWENFDVVIKFYDNEGNYLTKLKTIDMEDINLSFYGNYDRQDKGLIKNPQEMLRINLVYYLAKNCAWILSIIKNIVYSNFDQLTELRNIFYYPPRKEVCCLEV